MAGFSRSSAPDRSAYGRVGADSADRYAYGGGDRSAYGTAGTGADGGAGYATYSSSRTAGAGAGAPGAGYGQAALPPPPPTRKPVGAGYASSGYADDKAAYGAGGGAGRGGWTIVVSPPEHILSNAIVVNPQEWGGVQYVLVDQHFVFTAVADRTRAVQPGTIGAGALQREWARLSQGQEVAVQAFDPYSQGNGIYLAGLDLEVDFLARGAENREPYSQDEMAENFLRSFNGHIFSVGQLIVQEFHGVKLKLEVKGVNVVEAAQLQAKNAAQAPGHTSYRGILMPETTITYLKSKKSILKLTGSAKRGPTNAILAPNFKFEDMGIGGLDTEFAAIFRRAFASRIFPPALVDKLGIQHVKGIILYGPPGTGKTLLARQIGKMLNAREPKVVNGPEILNKYVGASEENIRKLFADAEKEYKEKGDESGLHIIIFDELDAICKQRGSTGGGTGVGDSVVNQLLSKMDGVDQLNNILIIGMTNRLDMIDEALLRPGRLEVPVEISLPDEHGRQQIISIQTSQMRKNGVMDSDVDIPELAALTKNFSGAEIAGLVKSATSFAFNRHVKVGTTAGISDDVENMRVNRDDFMHALDEVHPAFGVSEEELQQVVSNGIMHFAPHIDSILRDGQLRVEQVRTSSHTPLVTALLHGPPGSGKTALAATIAMQSGFPFIKLISPENMVGMGEAQKIAYMNKVFNDAYKSPLSVVVVDSIEKIIEWVPIGPRFQNAVLQALSILLGKRPPKERRLLVLGTTSNKPMLAEMEVADAFLADIRVPAISSLRSLDHVLREMRLFENPQDHTRCMQLLESAGLGEDRLHISIKKLLSEIEMARLDDDPADKLLAALNQV
ncbi:AAA-domain-containing protein [Tilletiaria anomala UBC 951]|uniref:Vesicular-fusion protein SEC18 n=1 Tax=Tilletiaria anomala (strain ATCC 24038 / CBS 436.72 / UBC 951) TaxID=1037660 RepID=A0A066VS36_TILAU|nr:AAA-domain-containing protein [Tilletiaria anomala UBC 951]KDN44542.1 AAA-domain-containing protein [Tilletiaria anomala UBC 951]